MKLSDQAIGTLMLTLQKCLQEQSDMTGLLKQLEFAPTGESQSELIVMNPPMVRDPRKVAELEIDAEEEVVS